MSPDDQLTLLGIITFLAIAVTAYLVGRHWSELGGETREDRRRARIRRLAARRRITNNNITIHAPQTGAFDEFAAAMQHLTESLRK